jgi:hypothetical protein
MYANPFDRKFGIEFEFSCPGIPMEQLPGARFSDYRPTQQFHNFVKILEDNNFKDWVVGNDGSEWEIKTGILNGPQGFKKVKQFLELVVGKYDAYVQLRADGLHVHHDAPEFIDNKEPAVRLVENWVENQDNILKMVDPCRVNRYACPKWGRDDLIRLQQSPGTSGFGRKNLNISALTRHGTIELRCHEGTLEYEEVLSWVRFGQSFIGKAVEETDSYVSAATADELLKKINVSRNASRFLSYKVQRNAGRPIPAERY